MSTDNFVNAYVMTSTVRPKVYPLAVLLLLFLLLGSLSPDKLIIILNKLMLQKYCY